MKSVIITGAALITLVLGVSAAAAKDVCLRDNFSEHYIIKKPKKLKPEGAIALTGLFVSSLGQLVPFDGSASMNSAGTVARFGIFVHGMATGSNNVTFEWTGDTTFPGTGNFDKTGTYNSNGSVTMTVEDCSTVIVP